MSARLHHIVPALVMCVGILGGCHFKQPPPPPPPAPATADMLQSMRESYQRVDPSARVGMVSAVDSATRLAAVKDLPVQDFREGNAVTFVDSQQQVIGQGRVVNVAGDTVYVRYEPATGPGQRAPKAGDIMVRVK